jgi:arginase family enzyme
MMNSMSADALLDLDAAWPTSVSVGSTIDARQWGPRLRYLTRPALIDSFYNDVAQKLPPFVLFGSGDFHHLTAVLLRFLDTPIHVVCFDNHPDWDIRPPRWACGAWVNRALDLPRVQSITVWGCGNFELAFPSRIFRSRNTRLTIHPWAERFSNSTKRLYPSMNTDNWRDHFEAFATSLAGKTIYVTIDMDCLRHDDAITNWENGLFTPDDLSWALKRLHQSATVIAGDVCGAYSRPAYATRFQRLAGWWDHPPAPAVPLADAQAVNLRSLNVIWPALTAT